MRDVYWCGPGDSVGFGNNDMSGLGTFMHESHHQSEAPEAPNTDPCGSLLTSYLTYTDEVMAEATEIVFAELLQTSEGLPLADRQKYVRSSCRSLVKRCRTLDRKLQAYKDCLAHVGASASDIADIADFWDDIAENKKKLFEKIKARYGGLNQGELRCACNGQQSWCYAW